MRVREEEEQEGDEAVYSYINTKKQTTPQPHSNKKMHVTALAFTSRYSHTYAHVENSARRWHVMTTGTTIVWSEVTTKVCTVS